MLQPSKSGQQQDTQRQMEEFISSGGKIQNVAIGESGEGPEQWRWNDSRYPNLRKQRDIVSTSQSPKANFKASLV